ncbi:MAG: aminopeptidase [Terriglobia bacterium]
MNLKAQCAAPIQWQHARRVSPRTAITYLFSLVLASLFAGTVAASDTSQNTSAADRKDLITAVKRLERKLGFRRTKNFHSETTESAVAYRCYYTGKLELPASYSGLQLVQGTKAGCPVDPQKYDAFFYPLDASGSGKTPLSATLAHESTERFLVVVPHEDFHANKELSKLPETWGEASSTLIGFLAAAEVARQKFGEDSDVYQNLRREPDLFVRKAEIVNRYHAQLSELYAAARAGEIPERDALAQKQQAFEELRQACVAIAPEPKSFNRCPAANNNAGLAFDETYTKYYSMMHQLYLKEGRELKPTVEALERAMNAKTEAEALRNLKSAVMSEE